MNELDGSLEQYCSPYYDKHGLYNDGFPCPQDKYCCQNAEGMKYCCFKNDALISFTNNNHPAGQIASNLYTTISNNLKFNKNSNDAFVQQKQHQQQNSIDSPSNGLFNSSNLLISNSAILVTSSIALSILIIAILVIFFCICRKKRDRKHSLLKPRLHSTVTSSTCTASSLSTPIGGMNIDHTNLLIDDLNDCKTSLSIDASQYNCNGNHNGQSTHRSNYISSGSGAANGGMVTSNYILNMSNSTQHTSSSGTNITQTSFLPMNPHAQHQPHMFNFNTDRDIITNDGDFIMYTSNNLDYLKAHSTFNSAQLNYYPTLPNVKVPTEEPPAYTPGEMQKLTPNTSVHMNDFRFSTFLPPHYTKHEVL